MPLTLSLVARMILVVLSASSLGCGSATPSPLIASSRGEAAPLEVEPEVSSIGEHLTVRPLPGGRAWIITHAEPISANSLVYLMADGTPVLADTPWTPRATRALLRWVEARFGRLPALLTVSHYHLDASGGIGAAIEAGVPVLASEHTARLLRERGPGMLAELAGRYGGDFLGWEAGRPDRIFAPDEGFRETIGGTEVRVLFPGGGHARDNVVTFFEDTQLLFGGCMVKGGPDLGYLGDADLLTWPAANAALIGLDPRVVVPGHGQGTGPELLTHTRALLEARAER